MVFSEKIKNFQLPAIKGLIFLLPFLPLYISTSMFFPYITGKNFAFRILVEFAAALWLPLVFINKEYRLRSSAITLSILIFTFIAGFANLMGVSPYNSFWSNYERMEGYITVLHLALYFVILRSVLRDKKDWAILFNLFVAVSVFVSLYALIINSSTPAPTRYTWEYGERLMGTIGNPPFLASYLLLSVFLALILMARTKRKHIGFLYMAPVLLNSCVIYFTASRGAILSAAIGTLMFVFFYIFGKPHISRGKLFKKIALLLLIAIVLSIVFLNFAPTDLIRYDKTFSRFFEMLSDPSVKTRLDAWSMAWNGIKERPLLGWGQENFIGVYTVNPIPGIDGHIWVDRAHNIVIDWLVNTGFLGFFSYLAIFVSAFYLTRKAYCRQKIKKSEALVIVTAFIVYFIQNLFTFDTVNTYLIFFALLAYVDSCVSGEDQLYPALKSNIDSKKTMVKYVSTMSGALLCFSFAFYYMNYKPIEQNRQLFRISFSSPEHDSYSILLSDFNKVLSYNTFGNADVQARMISMSRHILRRHLIYQEGAMKFIQATMGGVGKGVALNRYDLEYLTNIINFLKDIAVYDPSFIDRAEALINGCMRITPDYHWLYVVLSDVYILKKDYESAYVAIRKMVELDPRNDKKQLELARVAIYASREDVLSRSLENIKNIREGKNENIASGRLSLFSAAELYEFANVYRKIGDYQKSLEYLKELTIILSDKNKLYLSRNAPFQKRRIRAKVYFELAQTYMVLGDRENALKEAEKAAELDPLNFKEKAGRIID